MLKMPNFRALRPHAWPQPGHPPQPFPRSSRPAAAAPEPAATRPMARLCALPLLAVSLAAGGAAAAEGCSTASSGAGCVVAAAPTTVSLEASEPDPAGPLVEIGQVLERGQFSMLLNADYYGLPPVRDGWVYLRIGHDVYRVDWRSHEVLERVTHQTASNF